MCGRPLRVAGHPERRLRPTGRSEGRVVPVLPIELLQELQRLLALSADPDGIIDLTLPLSIWRGEHEHPAARVEPAWVIGPSPGPKRQGRDCARELLECGLVHPR